MITGLSHVCFRVRDLQQSIEFYRDRLGLAIAFDFKDEAGNVTGVYLFAGGRTFLELFKGNPEPLPDNVSFRHICLEVDDIDETIRALKEAGVEISDAKLGADGSLQAWLTDPEGNRIELHQFLTDSLQTQAIGRLRPLM